MMRTNHASYDLLYTHVQLSKSPYYYDGHVQLIKLLRLQGNLDKSREARNTMRRIFPLTEGKSVV